MMNEVPVDHTSAVAIPVVPSQTEITFRDCFQDHVDTPSHTVFEGQGVTAEAPLVTIAVPTFQRAALLTETIRSALAQDFIGTVEVLVVDNDPASSERALLERVPEIRTANLRYVVNERNIGMFGNWNRCIELARGAWITILNDDDLIDPNYLTQMFAAIRGNPAIDGIICRKRFLDQRPAAPSRDRGRLKQLAARAWLGLRFQTRPARPIGFNKLYWGGMLGNSAGFLFRPEQARRIGGFYPEEFPGADHWFYIRFTKLFRLWQHRAVAASIRIANNESAKPTTLEGFVLDFHRMQVILAGSEVPSWWLRLAPLMHARHLVEIRQFWRKEFDTTDVERKLGIKLTRDRPWLLWSIRALLRGY